MGFKIMCLIEKKLFELNKYKNWKYVLKKKKDINMDFVVVEIQCNL